MLDMTCFHSQRGAYPRVSLTSLILRKREWTSVLFESFESYWLSEVRQVDFVWLGSMGIYACKLHPLDVVIERNE